MEYYLESYKKKESISCFLSNILQGGYKYMEDLVIFKQESEKKSFSGDLYGIIKKFLEILNNNTYLIKYIDCLYELKIKTERILKFLELSNSKNIIDLFKKIMIYYIFIKIEMNEEEYIFLAILNTNHINDAEKINGNLKQLIIKNLNK